MHIAFYETSENFPFDAWYEIHFADSIVLDGMHAKTIINQL